MSLADITYVATSIVLFELLSLQYTATSAITPHATPHSLTLVTVHTTYTRYRLQIQYSCSPPWRRWGRSLNDLKRIRFVDCAEQERGRRRRRERRSRATTGAIEHGHNEATDMEIAELMTKGTSPPKIPGEGKGANRLKASPPSWNMHLTCT